MYAIDTSNHTVNDKKVDTFLRTVLDGDTHLEVEAGTTGFTGACCRVACCGDEGLNAIMKSLAFAYHAIDDQCCDVDD